MLRTLFWFIYFFLYLFYTLPALNKVKKLDVNIPIDERDRLVHNVPQKWAKSLVKVTGSKVVVSGEEHIPEGPVLFVSNHQGNFDIPVLIGFIDRPKGFLSKVEVKKLPIVPNWMEEMHCVFLNRNDRRQSVKAFQDAIKLLEKGHSMVVFPEGTRSKGHKMSEFKSGSLRLAVKSGVPIVPVTINHTYKIMEQNSFGLFIKPATVEVIISDPIFITEKDEKGLKELSSRVQDVIRSQIKN